MTFRLYEAGPTAAGQQFFSVRPRPVTFGQQPFSVRSATQRQKTNRPSASASGLSALPVTPDGSPSTAGGTFFLRHAQCAVTLQLFAATYVTTGCATASCEQNIP
jgi:hypothetical protein